MLLRPGRPRLPEPAGRVPWAGAAGIGAGYLAGHAVVHGAPALPPAESTGWLFWLALAAALAGLLEAWMPPRSRARHGIRLLVAAAVPAAILSSRIRTSFEVWQSALLVPVLAAAVLLLWTLLEGLARRRAGVIFPVVLLVSTISAGVGLLISNCLIYGQLGGALAAAIGASIPFAVWKPHFLLARSGSGVAAVVIGGLLLCGNQYADLPRGSAVLFALGPLGAWVGEWNPVRRLPPRVGVLVQALAVAVPLAAGLWQAIAASPGFSE